MGKENKANNLKKKKHFNKGESTKRDGKRK